MYKIYVEKINTREISYKYFVWFWIKINPEEKDRKARRIGLKGFGKIFFIALIERA